MSPLLNHQGISKRQPHHPVAKRPRSRPRKIISVASVASIKAPAVPPRPLGPMFQIRIPPSSTAGSSRSHRSIRSATSQYRSTNLDGWLRRIPGADAIADPNHSSSPPDAVGTPSLPPLLRPAVDKSLQTTLSENGRLYPIRVPRSSPEPMSEDTLDNDSASCKATIMQPRRGTPCRALLSSEDRDQALFLPPLIPQSSASLSSSASFRLDLADIDYEDHNTALGSHGSNTMQTKTPLQSNPNPIMSTGLGSPGAGFIGSTHSPGHELPVLDHLPPLPEYHFGSDSEGLFKDEASATPLTIMARQVLSWIYGKIDGCGSTLHQVRHNSHMESARENHYPLSATYIEVPSELDPSIMGLSSSRFPSNDGHSRSIYTSAPDLAEVFEGARDSSSIRKNICLHTEETISGRSYMLFDTDSMIVWLNHLGALKSFQVVFSHHKAYNIQYGLHFKHQIHYTNRRGKRSRATVQLKEIPQILWGWADEMWHAPIILFLPALYDEENDIAYLTDEQATLVFDRLLACTEAYLRTDHIQHHPRTSKAAEAIAGAGQHHASVSYVLPPDALTAIWDDFLARTANDPTGTSLFDGAFLVANAKGFKTKFKDGSVLGAMDLFERTLEKTFNMDQCNWDLSTLDFAHEICPLGDKGQSTLLLKTCCLKRQAQTIQEKFFGASKGRVNIYHPGFLQETGTLTFEPPIHSIMREGGLLYGQFYNSIKAIWDLNKNIPYQEDDFLALAVDRATYASCASQAKVSHVKTYKKLSDNWQKDAISLLRMGESAYMSSWGVRIEFRITWTLWREMRRLERRKEAKLEPHQKAINTPVVMMSSPTHVWSLPTKTYVDFILGNFHKFATAFEVAQVTSKNSITFEQTKLLTHLLMCMAAFPTGQQNRKLALWMDEREDEHGVCQGLAFRSSLLEHGYAWFVCFLIDWQRFIFRPDVSPHMRAIPWNTLGWYREAGHLVQDTQEALDMCEEFLGIYPSLAAQRQLLELMIHLCLRQYRRDVLEALNDQHDFTNDILKASRHEDVIAFTYDGLSMAFGVGFNFLRGNRSKNGQSPELLFEWIWGSTNVALRKHFEHKPFRNSAQRCRNILAHYPALFPGWNVGLREEFFRCHRVVPFPNTNGTLISTSGTQRSWYSIIQDQERQSRWKWGRTGYDTVEISYPAVLTQTRDEIQSLMIQLEKRQDYLEY